LGNYSLLLGLFFGLVLFYFSANNFRNSKVLSAKILSFTFLQFFLVVISFLCLVLSFVVSDFSNETVFNNSHTTKPIFYKIAGTLGKSRGKLIIVVACFNIVYINFFIED
jgi:cytochrome c-type biogenesis protein CcmF